MIRAPRLLRPFPLAIVLAAAGQLSAQAVAPASNLAAPESSTHASEPEPRPLLSRIRGLFEVDLPELDSPGTVRLTFRPHVADLIKRDYLRVATGLRWAVAEDLEINAEGEVFATHGLGDHNDDGYGVGELRLGARYVKRRWPRRDYESSFALDLQFPTGDPPFDLTDGHNHLTPSFVTQHHWATNPKVTVFGSVAWDIVTPSSVPGAIGRNTPRDDSIAITGGAIYDAGELKWTLQATYANTWVSGRDEHFLTLRPSVLWFVPRKYTFHMKTQWILGLGLRSTWGPDGHDFSTNSRIRAELTFRQVMDSLRRR